jgi:sensor domain CHASE-containing protein
MSSIRRRLTVHLVLLFVVLFVALLGVVYAAVRSTLTASLDASLRDRVVTLASIAEDEREGVELELPVEFARSIGDKK